MKKTFIYLFSLLAFYFLVLLTGCTTKEEKNMENEKQLVERYVDVWNGADTAALGSILTSNYVRHTTRSSGPANNPKELKKVIAALRLDVPDLKINVEDILIKDNNAIFRWTSEGTDSGPGDFPPTNKRFTSTGMTWLRFENGHIAEEWSDSDQLDVMLQLGFGIKLPEK